MKYVLIFFYIFSLSVQGKEIEILTDLSALKWENRIILVLENKINETGNTLNIFEQNKDEINERDIAWFVIQNETVKTNFNGVLGKGFLSNTHKKYEIEQGHVILLGKDGGLKSYHESVDLEAIFLEIDTMPMRQVEMQHQ